MTNEEMMDLLEQAKNIIKSNKRPIRETGQFLLCSESIRRNNFI